MPKAPKFSLALIGPGVVLIAMGLGSGEYILWPNLIAEFGFGILWGALVGITFQLLVSNESGRYTLATGASVYHAFHRLNKFIPVWFIASTFVSFAWPGIILSGGRILGEVIGVDSYGLITVILLILIGLILMFGGKVYDNVERFQKFVIIISIPALIIITAFLIDIDVFLRLSQGLIGIGEGYMFFPSQISVLAFLGAVAYSGAGGNLVLSHSFYIQDEGLGMAKYTKSQIDRKSKKEFEFRYEDFEESKENISEFKRWMKITGIEQIISFWFLGFLTIILLAVISYVTLYPYIGEGDLAFIFQEAEALSNLFGNFVGVFFLLIGVLFLFKTQLGVYETTSRIMTENVQLISKTITKKFKRSDLYYFFLWLQIIAASIIALVGFEQPIFILLIGTFFSALSMFALSGLMLWLNSSFCLPKSVKPTFLKRGLLLISTIFYGIFVGITVWEWF